MSRKAQRVRAVSPTEASSYLDKAKEFESSMLDEYRAGRWNAAALAGIHASISATDAVLGKLAGQRSAAEDHHVVVDILRAKLSSRVAKEKLDDQLRRLGRVLGLKNLVEYESRSFNQTDCDSLVKDVSRYLDWAKSQFI
ncbi:hypothetical protein EPO15_08870 [bacterium]|nr:MAG: hypothetical protein EPO15_08870 [bacterium]